MDLLFRALEKSHTLREPGGRLGSQAGTAITISDGSVLAEHAEFSWDNGRWWIKPLSLQSPVYLNGHRLAPAKQLLGISGKLKFGDVVVEFSQVGAASKSKPEVLTSLTLSNAQIEILRNVKPTSRSQAGDDIPTMLEPLAEISPQASSTAARSKLGNEVHTMMEPLTESAATTTSPSRPVSPAATSGARGTAGKKPAKERRAAKAPSSVERDEEPALSSSPQFSAELVRQLAIIVGLLIAVCALGFWLGSTLDH